MIPDTLIFLFFFFNDTATTEIYTLSLHDALPICAGEAMMNRIYAAVTQSPAWSRAVLVINFDEWGGFFDHVPPSVTPIPPADQAAGNADGRRGFRTPTLLISPFARRAGTSHVLYDHTS